MYFCFLNHFLWNFSLHFYFRIQGFLFKAISYKYETRNSPRTSSPLFLLFPNYLPFRSSFKMNRWAVPKFLQICLLNILTD